MTAEELIKIFSDSPPGQEVVILYPEYSPDKSVKLLLSIEKIELKRVSGYVVIRTNGLSEDHGYQIYSNDSGINDEQRIPQTQPQ